MSNEEQHEIVGRSVAEYGQVRQNLAAHLAEAERLGGILVSIGVSLRSDHGGGLKQGLRPDKLGALPTQQRISEVVEEVIKLRLRKTQLAAQLEELGVPLKG